MNPYALEVIYRTDSATGELIDVQVMDRTTGQRRELTELEARWLNGDSTPQSYDERQEWVFTIDRATGAATKVEVVDSSSGQRYELSEQEMAWLDLGSGDEPELVGTEEWIYTVDQGSGTILKVETVDSLSGQRRELTEEEYGWLLPENNTEQRRNGNG